MSQTNKSMAKILIICHSVSKCSGNLTTAERIRTYLETIVECKISNPSELTLRNSSWDGIIAIHAYHSASILEGCKSPYMVIFGGTDLNEYSQKKEYFAVMSKVVKGAWKLITFGPSMTRKAFDLWPDLIRNKIIEIPQAVQTLSSKFNLRNYLKNKLNVAAEKIFLLVLGIRPVKDPLFLLSEFEEWHRNHEDCWLIIIGSKMDEEYYYHVAETVKGMDGIMLLTDIPKNDVHAAMKDSVAVINCSLSEGMCSSILEAMDLEVPVIARDIPGNKDLIEDKVNGLLYQTPQEFLGALELLLSCGNLRQDLVKNAKLQLRRNHQSEKEAFIYVNLVRSMLSLL